MDTVKLAFVQNDMMPLFKKLTPGIVPQWGIMNVQQMVEHFSNTMRSASGKSDAPLFTSLEHLPKMRAFMLSNKPFRENTKNPMLDTPPALRNTSLENALTELETEVNDFFSAFANDPALVTLNPIFGELNFEDNIHLLHKHALHHLRQFNII